MARRIKNNEIKLCFYVLNYNQNSGCVEPFNIFRNFLVNDKCVRCVRKYLRNLKAYKETNRRDELFYGFEGLCESIRQIIMWQEWARREYEISVGDAFEDDLNEFEKWDCYKQALPNIEIITRECIYQVKNQLKALKENC